MRTEHRRLDANDQEAPSREGAAWANGLASVSMSRRQALLCIGGALAGGLLAFIPGAAWAQEPQGPPTGFGDGRLTEEELQQLLLSRRRRRGVRRREKL